MLNCYCVENCIENAYYLYTISAIHSSLVNNKLCLNTLLVVKHFKYISIILLI